MYQSMLLKLGNDRGGGASCDGTATTASEITKVENTVWVSPNVYTYHGGSGYFHSGVLTTTGADLVPIEIHNGQKISLNIEIPFN